MGFKEQIAADLEAFINPLEFADQHEINGKIMNAVIDDNSLEEKKGSRVDVLAVYGEQTTLYVKECDYGGLPRRGAAISIDGETWRVKGAARESGIYEIVIERVVSNAQSRRPF